MYLGPSRKSLDQKQIHAVRARLERDHNPEVFDSNVSLLLGTRPHYEVQWSGLFEFTMAPNAGKPSTVIVPRERGPGPGRYALPSTCGFIGHDNTKQMKPAYSFGRRLGDFGTKKECSPGPKYFIEPTILRTGKDGTPAYSLLKRQRYLGIFKTPSPGAYSPEKVHPQGEVHAARHSMGARTRYRQQDGNPSPNKYTLPKVLGALQPDKQSSQAYSISGRSKIGGYAEDFMKTPGPGNYNATILDVYRAKAPLYSMRRRSYMPGDNTQKPGPGAHYPEGVIVNRPTPPTFSLGIRHSEFVCPLITDL